MLQAIALLHCAVGGWSACILHHEVVYEHAHRSIFVWLNTQVTCRIMYAVAPGCGAWSFVQDTVLQNFAPTQVNHKEVISPLQQLEQCDRVEVFETHCSWTRARWSIAASCCSASSRAAARCRATLAATLAASACSAARLWARARPQLQALVACTSLQARLTYEACKPSLL